MFGLKLKTQNTPLRVWAGRSCWEIRWSCFNRMTEFLIFTAHSIGVFHLSCTYILNIKSCSILFLKFHCVHLFTGNLPLFSKYSCRFICKRNLFVMFSKSTTLCYHLPIPKPRPYPWTKLLAVFKARSLLLGCSQKPTALLQPRRAFLEVPASTMAVDLQSGC